MVSVLFNYYDDAKSGFGIYLVLLIERKFSPF